MNYIELINYYWQLREQGIVSGAEGDLYLYLLHTSNKLGWKNPFNQSNRLICAYLNLSEKSLIKYRNVLKQSGLIDFESGKATKQNSSYTLLNPCNGYSSLDSSLGSSSDNCCKNYSSSDSGLNSSSGSSLDSSLGNNRSDNNKLINKTKLNKDVLLNPPEEKDEEKLKTESGKNKKSKKEVTELKFPFSSEKFMNAWEQLINTPKWKKKIPYTLQLALNQLSKYEEEFAIKLIEAAAANDWQGVVFPQTDEQYSKWKSGRTAGKSNFANHDNTKHYDEF